LNSELVEDESTQEPPSTSTYDSTSSGAHTFGYYSGPPLDFTTPALDNTGSPLDFMAQGNSDSFDLPLEPKGLGVLHNSDSLPPQILDSVSEADTWDENDSSEDPKSGSEGSSSVHSQVSDDEDGMEVDSSSDSDEIMCAEDIPELVKL
jgi:hypothetical protein